MHRRVLVLVVAALLTTAACSSPQHRDTPSDRMSAPEPGSCRMLSAADLTEPTNDDPPVSCTGPHTAETFATGSIPGATGTGYAARANGAFVYKTCQPAYQEFLGVDDSLVLRIQLSWAWFRPSKKAWEKGARWFRCDVVGGPMDPSRLRDLPTRTRGLFAAAPAEDWTTCAAGPSMKDSQQVPCGRPHDWRAVTAVKVGAPDDAYPGDRVVEVRSRDRCSDWVGAWLHYTPAYDFGYTWFHEAEWKAGIRRSVCWARTDQ